MMGFEIRGAAFGWAVCTGALALVACGGSSRSASPAEDSTADAPAATESRTSTEPAPHATVETAQAAGDSHPPADPPPADPPPADPPPADPLPADPVPADDGAAAPGALALVDTPPAPTRRLEVPSAATWPAVADQPVLDLRRALDAIVRPGVAIETLPCADGRRKLRVGGVDIGRTTTCEADSAAALDAGDLATVVDASPTTILSMPGVTCAVADLPAREAATAAGYRAQDHAQDHGSVVCAAASPARHYWWALPGVSSDYAGVVLSAAEAKTWLAAATLVGLVLTPGDRPAAPFDTPWDAPPARARGEVLARSTSDASAEIHTGLPLTASALAAALPGVHPRRLAGGGYGLFAKGTRIATVGGTLAGEPLTVRFKAPGLESPDGIAVGDDWSSLPEAADTACNRRDGEVVCVLPGTRVRTQVHFTVPGTDRDDPPAKLALADAKALVGTHTVGFVFVMLR